MKNRITRSLVTFLTLAAFAILPFTALAVENTQVRPTDNGYVVAETASQKVGFWGATPIVQPSGASQAALTDNTTGTASSTLAAGVGVQTIAIPLILPSLANGDVLTEYTPGYAFKVLSASVAVTKVVTTAAKAATLNLEIGTTNLTGGVIALTSANCTPLGAVVAGTSITAANTGTASDTISIEASSVTAFVEGEAVLLLKIQNMDTANAAASQAAQANAIRAALVLAGLIKGSS